MSKTMGSKKQKRKKIANQLIESIQLSFRTENELIKPLLRDVWIALEEKLGLLKYLKLKSGIENFMRLFYK